MRIVIDMQGAQTASRFRGIGRYTLSFAHAVISQAKGHEVLLLLNGLFPETLEPIRSEFASSLPARNILIWTAPGPIQAVDNRNQMRNQTAELIREAFFSCLEPDVVHVTSLFEGFGDEAAISVGLFDKETPVSTVLYDLIPLLNPEKYLANRDVASFYERRLQSLMKSTSLLAISDYSRQEGIRNLPEQAGRIANISSATDRRFRPITVDAQLAQDLLERLGVCRPFVMYSGGGDERKNLPRLVEAWALLPASVRSTHQLLFAGKLYAPDLEHLRNAAIEFQLTDGELIFTDYVSDEELVHLYNLCKLFVFPSWHEGFGLPALEAMACGAAVIGSNATSLPEVINLPEALFDPLNARSIAGKLQEALEDEAFLQRLKDHGLQQAKNFSWEITAKRAMTCWESIALNRQASIQPWQHRRYHYIQVQHDLVQRLTQMDHIRSSDKELRALASALALNEEQLLDFLKADGVAL